MSSAPTNPVPLVEPIARSVCVPDAAGGASCEWYHGLWQYLRLFKLVGTPERHAAFFHRWLGDSSARPTRPRILISGTADYAILAHVIRGVRAAGAEPDITVIDRCPTPLSLCGWYAARNGIAIETQAAEVLDYEAAEPFDAICTHSFLPQFAPDTRPEIVSHWSSLLRPRGRVITNASIRTEQQKGPFGFGAEEAAAFCATVRREAEKVSGTIGCDPDDLAGLSPFTLESVPHYPVRGPEATKGAVIFSHGRSRIVDTAKVVGVPMYFRPLHGAAWDVIALKRPAANDNREAATRYLLQAIDQLRARGYERIVLAGQSAGGWASIDAAGKVKVHAVLATAPAAHGTDPDSVVQGTTAFGKLLRRLKPTRVMIFFFTNDPHQTAGRGAIANEILKTKEIPYEVIDQPRGLAGHYAHDRKYFASRFGQRIKKFIDGSL